MTPPATAGPGPRATAPGATAALVLLLLINLFNYIDRQVLSAVIPRLEMDGTLFAPDAADTKFWLGLLPSAFMVSYMLFSPLVGWLDGHGYRRWVILGLGVTVWSLASGFSGFAASYWMLLATRCLVGIGEGAYGPVASAMLADAYPAHKRGVVMALFNMAIPVGSALGFVIGGQVSEHFNDWRHAFWVTFAGLLLGAVCFTRRELPRPPRAAEVVGPGYFAVLARLAKIPSFVLCCAGMTAITFVIGGVAAWVPAYVFEREARFALTAETFDKMANPTADEKRRPVPAEVVAKLAPKPGELTLPELKAYLAAALPPGDAAQYQEPIASAAVTPASPTLGGVNTIFGVMVVLGGLAATAVGAWLGEKFRPRVRGAYFWVIGLGALAAAPAYVGFLYAPFPTAWGLLFFAVFGLFLHTGPAFTALANVVTTEVRATAFAINILVIHALGDMISPPLIGKVAGMTDLHTAFLLTGAMILVGGVVWLAGIPFLDADTKRAETMDAA